MSNGRLAFLVAMVFVAFLGLSFALVPLYRTFCEATGLNGTTETAAPGPLVVDLSRRVSVEFTSTVMPGLPWRFEAKQRRVRVHPGELATVVYQATNTADHTTIGKAVMSVTPETAATHFKKVMCFCFADEKLGAHETRDFGLEFYVDRDLPDYLKTITLSYSVFLIEKPSS